MRLLSYSLLFPFVILFSSGSLALSIDRANQKALEIRKHLESHLYTFPLEQQGKYALMLYRTTGNKTYLNTARVILYLSSSRLQQLEKEMQNKAARRKFLVEESQVTSKYWVEPYADHYFYGFLMLPELILINQFAMTLKGGLGEKINRAVSGFDFKPGLASPELISKNGPKLAEQVYALLRLGMGDHRPLFIEAFQDYYPDSNDAELPVEQLTHKWLTMTHLVLAASDQLQEPVNDPLLQWIPKYFTGQGAKILKESDSELLAKIGLVLILTGTDSESLQEGIRQRLSKRPLTDTVTEADFWSMLLLGWIRDYFPDPALYRMTRFRNKTPYVLKPVQ